MQHIIHTVDHERLSARRWRRAVWGLAALLLALPLLAMQFSGEVRWGALDFAVFAAMLACAGGAYELAARAQARGSAGGGRGGNRYRAAAAVAIGAGFLLVWVNLAVGLIGGADRPANALFVGVLLIGSVGAALARLQARGMVWTLLAVAAAQAAVGLAALLAGWRHPPLATLFFVALWLISARLFQLAARGQR